MQLTYKFRLRDKHRRELNRQARAVNFVWNFANETQRNAVRDARKWPTGYDIEKLAACAPSRNLQNDRRPCALHAVLFPV